MADKNPKSEDKKKDEAKDDKSASAPSILGKIRTGVKTGVEENIASAKEAALSRVYDVPVFGTILKNIAAEMKKDGSKADTAKAKNDVANAAKGMSTSLRNIEKSVIQISDNIYNIAAAVGAQLTSMQETEDSIRRQKEEAERDKEADARPAKTEAGPTPGDTAKKPGILARLTGGMESTLSKLGSGILSFITNPYTLIAGLVASIGYGVYKYFTDDNFKDTINDMFQKVMDFDVVENIVKPLGDILTNIGAGIAKLTGMLIKWVAELSIPLPDIAQKMGLPSELKPFEFMKSAGENLEGWADSIFKQRRDEKAAKKAAEEAARPPEAKPSSGAPAGFAARTQSSGTATTWSQSVEAAHAQAMPASVTAASGVMAIASKFIAAHEGLPSGGKAFWDPPGQKNLVSIGYGHQIQDFEYKQGFIQVGNEQIPLRGERGVDTTLTKEQAQALLAQDLPRYEKRAAGPLGEAWNKLSDNQKAALISYAYNTGSTASLVKNGLKDAILSGDMATASQIIADKGVRTAGGQVLGGLVKRRAAESALFASNAKQEATQVAAATPAAPPPTPVATPPAGGLGSTASLTVSPTTAPGAQVAAAAPNEPTTGSAVGALSATVADLKLGPPPSSVAVNNTNTGQTKMSAFTGGAIPSPIAERCSIDRFNFFEPYGNMKVA